MLRGNAEIRWLIEYGIRRAYKAGTGAKTYYTVRDGMQPVDNG